MKYPSFSKYETSGLGLSGLPYCTFDLFKNRFLIKNTIKQARPLQENAKDSDIDIVVETDKRNLLNRIGLKMSLEDFFGMPVDVVTYREDLSPLLKERISKEVIYV